MHREEREKKKKKRRERERQPTIDTAGGAWRMDALVMGMELNLEGLAL